jgi:hypothetical protein
MALTTYEEIKAQIRAELPNLMDNPYAEDAIGELSESAVPVYNNEVMQQWCELSSDDSDQWKVLGYDTQRNEGGILTLMSVDLAIYYAREFDRAWNELRGEIED